jgi:phosphoenolpyruvate carboxykinase (diphosphate)
MVMTTNTRAAIALRLALIGQDLPGTQQDPVVAPLLARQRELNRRLADRLSAPDQRIQDFLDDYLAGTDAAVRLPRRTLVLDQPGLARELSLPQDADAFTSDLLSSYRLRNGVLHNPANDRRTTAGVFHIAEGGMAIPDDKIAVDRTAAGRIFAAAFDAPTASLRLPYAPVECWVSLLLRPLVRPAVPGIAEEVRLETRFIVPGGLVANLDFVESIFGNAGDPYLPENDASLDPAHWTGHTGLVVLAPHLTHLTKKALGLPNVDDATERQRRDGQCWSDEAELYNGGQAFKLCLRDERGVVVTVIADNYFGYCKKEVKTQISYSANLLGNAEEEHAGGAIVFPAYNLGREFTDTHTPPTATLASVVARDPQRFVLQPDGSVLDAELPDVTLVPGRATFSLNRRTVEWDADGVRQSIPFDATRTYVMPHGYRVHAKHRETDKTQWHIVGTSPVATHCHKPATVSGGGKSEISKSILDAFVFGDAYAADFEADMDAVAALIAGDYSDRFADPASNGTDHRPILGIERSFGSVIKMLTPSSLFNDEYNQFLDGIPSHVKELLFTVKRYYRTRWGDDWRSHFSVGITNGRQGNAVRLDGAKIVANFLRVGFNTDGSWRLFSTRPDFTPASKVQTEDDITASTVVPAFGPDGVSRKIVENCEQRLFQRPDDAIEPGYDKQTELDMSRPGTFISNFQPLTRADAAALVGDVQEFSKYTAPMADLVRAAAFDTDPDAPAYFVCSAKPRLVGGKPSKNPRYLQVRPDLANPRATALAELASHLYRGVSTSEPLSLPVDVVAAGRRNNPGEPGVPPLCTYNPLHYMDLPELFAEFISSMTGKSPSTTGAGSEGAMTKGPFNALPAIIDLNAALLSFALTGYDGWLSSAGFIGPNVQVAHDISMLIPELFCRMTEPERAASTLIEGGYLERLADFTHDGRLVQASRLGYRINERFATTFFGRIFLHPDVVFTDEMLRPELQDADAFAESMATIVATHERVARAYVADGTIELAVPPLRALLEIMADGASAEGWTFTSPEFRELFTRSSVLASDWYAERIAAQQAGDIHRAAHGVTSLEHFAGNPDNAEASERLGLPGRIAAAKADAKRLASNAYRKSLVGAVGRQPL